MKQKIYPGIIAVGSLVTVIDTSIIGAITIKSIRLTNQNDAVIKYRYYVAPKGELFDAKYYRRFDAELLEFEDKNILCQPLELETDFEVKLYSDTDNVSFNIDLK